MPVAHPLTEPFLLPVSPLLAAWIAAALVWLAGTRWPGQSEHAGHHDASPTASWSGTLSVPQRLTRLLAVALLGLAVAAGRLGADDELENLAPALVVGAGWPLLVLVSAVAGPVWRWLDPWDALARLLCRGQAGDEPGNHVWPAAALALPWVWYLSAYSEPLSPRAVGAVLGLYTIVTLAGCLAVGRRRWLSTAEPLGIVLSWTALLPQRRLGGWRPPPGAPLLLGVLGGGILFGAVRRSELWGDLNTIDAAAAAAALGLLGACTCGGGVLTWLGSRSTAVARGAVPAVAAIVVAVAMERHRVFTSVQLLPGLLGDPFGEGWDLFGRAAAGLDPEPLGTRGLLWAQLAVLLAGHLVGAAVAASSVRRAARKPAAFGLSVLAAASVLALAAH